MGIAAKLDDLGKPFWIGSMVLGFLFFWPIGLVILGFLIWSGRMGCWRYGRMGHWHERGMARFYERAERWCGGRPNASSGNRAFDEYRAETLRRLEEEQRDFIEFLQRLRFAKDEAEFDEFLAERRRRFEGPEPQTQG